MKELQTESRYLLEFCNHARFTTLERQLVIEFSQVKNRVQWPPRPVNWQGVLPCCKRTPELHFIMQRCV